MRRVTLDEALWAIGKLPDFLPSSEPIGPLTTRGINALQSALHAPFISYGGKYKYRYLYHRAAVLFYMIAKDHAIGNGNKRCAVIITVVFLVLNGKIPNTDHEDMYNLAKEVAKSDARKSEQNIEALKRVFKEGIIDLPKDD